jgi:small neutral amino acid transporter SnatA (MarC family)
MIKKRYLIPIGIGIFLFAWAILGYTNTVQRCISPSFSDMLGDMLPLLKFLIGFGLIAYGLKELIDTI